MSNTNKPATRPAASPPGLLSIIMNSFVNRFSSTSAEKELRNDDYAPEDGQFPDTMWGSVAGFGSLAKGVPSFTVPAVPDVSNDTCSIMQLTEPCFNAAYFVLETTYRRSRRPKL